ncbi:hypothetical protein ACI78V_05145 [Geodermatophilus sp. SYSU D00742]
MTVFLVVWGTAFLIYRETKKTGDFRAVVGAAAHFPWSAVCRALVSFFRPLVGRGRLGDADDVPGDIPQAPAYAPADEVEAGHGREAGPSDDESRQSSSAAP